MASSIAMDCVIFSSLSMLGNCERSRVEVGIHTLCQNRPVVGEGERYFGSVLPPVGDSECVTVHTEITS